MSLDAIDLFVMAVYMGALVGVGVFASRRIATSEDYAVAGRSFGMPVLLGTLIGSAIGAAATMGKAGKAYEAGYAVLLASGAYFLGYILLAFLAPKLRAARIDSMPDVLERRFGAGMRVMAAAVLLLVVIPVVGLQLIACGVILTEAMPGLGLGYAEAVVGSALVMVGYTLVGGLLAVAYTDLLQVVVMVLGLGLLLPIFVTADVGGLSALGEALVPPTTDVLGGMRWGYVLSFVPVFTTFVLIDPGAWQRIAAARDPRDLRPAMLWTAGFYGVWAVLVVALGVVAFNLHPELANGDAAIPQMVLDHMPVGLQGLCLAAIIALMMSTADTALLISGTTVSWDVLRVLRPQVPDRTLLLVSRVVILAVGALGVVFALTRISLFEVNIIALGLFVSGLFVPVMASLFYRRATSAGALASSIAGGGVVLACHVAQLGFGVQLPVEPIVAGLGASLLGLVLVSHAGGSSGRSTPPVLG
jgi:SSS family transporter